MFTSYIATNTNTSAAESHAHHVIQGHIVQEHAKQQGIELNLSRVAELAVARYQSKNSLGAIMSMRKYCRLLLEYERQTMIVSALQQLDNDVSNQLLPVDCYMNELKSLLEHENTDSASSSSSLSDNMLLGELSTSAFMKNALRKRDQSTRATAIVNEAA
jgi:hypothetical protein